MTMSSVSLTSLAETIRCLDNALKSHMITLDDLMEESKILSSVTKDGGGGGGGGGKETKSEVKENLIAKRSGKVTVTIRVLFLKIASIDTLHDRFSADVVIHTRWREPAFDAAKKSTEDVDWSQYWDPKLSVDNVIGEAKANVSNHLSYDKNGRAIVLQSIKIGGMFYEAMDLNQFPFDSQDLTVSIVSDLETNEVEFVEDLQERSGINVGAFKAGQEWTLKKNLNTWKKTNIKVINKQTHKYPVFCIAAKGSRKPQFFLWNIVLIMFSICSMAFGTFSVGLNVPQSRLQLSYFLILTTVTFKFVVNKSLPKISYLTYMDKYILGSMLILIGVCVWHAVVGSVIYEYLPKAATLGGTPRPTKSTPKFITTMATTTEMELLESSSDDYDVNDSSNMTNCPIIVVATTTATAAADTDPGDAALLSDRVALMIFGCIYIMFHFTFLFLIVYAAKTSEDPSNDHDKSFNDGVDDDD